MTFDDARRPMDVEPVVVFVSDISGKK